MKQFLRAHRSDFGAALFYLVIAVGITWPLVADLCGQFAGFAYGDGPEMARHIWWYQYALRTGQSVFWQPTLGYPDGMAGVLLWAHPQQFFPAWLLALVLPVPAAANISILFYMMLNGWAMFRLVQSMTQRWGAALGAGLVFMAAPTFQAHLAGGHAGLLVMWPVPLLILALFRLEAATLRWRWLLAAIALFVLSAGGHILQLIYVLMPVMGAWILRQLWRRDWRGLLYSLLITLAGGVVLLIFVLPIAQDTLATPAYTAEGGFVRYSADLLSIVSPSFFNPLYQGLSYPRQVLGVNLEEGSGYIGLVAGVLALAGLLSAWRRGAGWWLMLACIAWVLSLGPLLKVLDRPLTISPDGYQTYITLPWALMQNLPFFNLARTPGRFNFVLALAVTVLVGYGLAWLAGRLRGGHWQWLAGAVLFVAMLVDYQWYWPLPTISATIPAEIEALRNREDIRAVLDLPWDNTVAAKQGLYLQTGHQRPLVAGHVTRSTPVSPAKLTLLAQTLDPALLRAAGADAVIIHKAYADNTLLERARQQLGTPYYEDTAQAVFLTPQTEAAPQLAIWTPDVTQIAGHTSAYAYSPDAGWLHLKVTFSAIHERTVRLYLDDVRVHRWQVTETQTAALTLPVAAGQYHTVTLALDPPCPVSPDPVLRCATVAVSDFMLDYEAAPQTSAAFAQGVQLVAGMATQAVADSVAVNLLWAFEQPRSDTDIRFVHVLDADGQIIAQDDRTPGAQAAGDRWLESLILALPPDADVNTLQIYTGWYAYPDFTRFTVLGTDAAASAGLVQIPLSP